MHKDVLDIQLAIRYSKKEDRSDSCNKNYRLFFYISVRFEMFIWILLKKSLSQFRLESVESNL
jgi:hypothetical protein